MGPYQLRQQSARWTRRRVLKLGAAVVAGAVGTACDDSDEENAVGATQEPKGTEAPALAERVRSGDLPPVEERLPKSPLIVEPNDQTGVYGGTWRAVMLGPTPAWLERTIGYEYLVRWRPGTRTFDPDQVIPNVADSFEINDDATEYTFRLRSGMRWSDGEPFTADDIVFAYDDVLRNEDIFPVLPAEFDSMAGPATLEKLDKLTIKFTFPAPNGLFIQRLASKNNRGRELVRHPKHYLSTFHVDYAEDVDQHSQAGGFDDWVQMFSAKRDPWTNPELPTLNAWVVTSPVGESERVVAERNPYYWKVDPEGSQLPYLDSLVNDIIADPETMLLRATNGDIDMYTTIFTTFQNKSVLAQNREDGNYDFFDLVSGITNVLIVALNLTHEDPVKHEIFNNRDFRVGLSHAINRQEIIDTVYLGQATPSQVSPRAESDFYNETLATQYTAYDVDQANHYLDQAGYRERNDDGIRLGPDGGPISFSIQTIAVGQRGFSWGEVMELVKTYWREVGVDLNIQVVDNTLFQERRVGGQYDALAFQWDHAGLDPRLNPRYYVPVRGNNGQWYASKWADWLESGGEDGEEPPELTKQQMRLYDELAATADRDEQDRLLHELIDGAREPFYAIGIAEPLNGYGIKRLDFHNIPGEFLAESDYPEPAPTNPEQYYTTRK